MPGHSAVSELTARIKAVAQRLSAIKAACTNEESTKLHLIIPTLAALGYDSSNPFEVYPEHAASFDVTPCNRVDFAVMKDGLPVIAIECKKVGSDLSSDRAQLRGYFNAIVSVKLGILTNGVTWEFFVDSDEPNMMDEEPFLSVDLEAVGREPSGCDALRVLAEVAKDRFHPHHIAEIAHVELVRKRLRTAIASDLAHPSEELCRHWLRLAGVKNVRRSHIDAYYGPMVRDAITEVSVARTSLLPASTGAAARPSDDAAVDRIRTTDRELAIFGYVRRRLAFLVEDEHQFGAIEQVQYRDYIGKLVVYLDRERKGWLFRFFEGSDGFDKFVFPAPYGEIVTNNLLDIDGPLKAAFLTRARELLPLSHRRIA